MNQTCKIIALIHVIVFISAAIYDLTRHLQRESSSGEWIPGFFTSLAACFLGISWVLHNIICSYDLSYVWNIILLMIPILFIVYLAVYNLIINPPKPYTEPTNDDTQDTTK